MEQFATWYDAADRRQVEAAVVPWDGRQAVFLYG